MFINFTFCFRFKSGKDNLNRNLIEIDFYSNFNEI